MPEIYDGKYDSFRELAQGYWDYAIETVVNRSLPDSRDGLKPVYRRILYAMYVNKKLFMKSPKSITAVGEVLKYHPHGDTSIYEAATRMTDTRDSWQFSPLNGEGNLGDKFGNVPADPRYTHLGLGARSEIYFDHMDGVDLKPGELDDVFEPEFLPARFPVALVNSQKGLAVGMRCDIPGYNFWDVIDMAERVLKGEDLIGKYYAPDLSTGGIILNDKEEFQKILSTGRGKLTVRAKTVIKGNIIHVLDLPLNKSVEAITALLKSYTDKASEDYLPELVDADDNTGKSGFDLAIICKRGKAESVLMELYRRSVLQQTVRANLVFSDSNKPVFGGVRKIILSWEDGRKEVLTKSFTRRLDKINKEIDQLSWLLRLIQNEKARDEYVSLLVHSTVSKATEYLESVLEGIPVDVSKWISSLRAVEFNKTSKYVDKYNDNVKERDTYQYNIDNLDEYILNDLESLKKEFEGQFPRRSELSDTIYKFQKVKKKDEPLSVSTNWVSVSDDGMIYRTDEELRRKNIIFKEVLNSGDTIVCFDNYGQVIKIYLYSIPDTDKMGYRILDYAGLDMSDKPDWKILYATKLDGEDRVLIFDDGYVSIWKTSELMDSSVKRKVLHNGVNISVRHDLFAVYKMSDMPEILIMMDDTDPSNIKFSWRPVNEIKRTKSNTSRTQFIKADKVTGISGCQEAELEEFIPDYTRLYRRMRHTASIDSTEMQSLMTRSDYVQE